eukprot:Clim_evm68s142 gene=Clim_evmTU68s142
MPHPVQAEVASSTRAGQDPDEWAQEIDVSKLDNIQYDNNSDVSDVDNQDRRAELTREIEILLNDAHAVFEDDDDDDLESDADNIDETTRILPVVQTDTSPKRRPPEFASSTALLKYSNESEDARELRVLLEAERERSAKLNQDVHTLKSEHSEQVRHFLEKLEVATQRIHELETRESDAQTNEVRLETKIDDLEAQIKSLHVEVERKKEQVVEYTVALETTQQENAELKRYGSERDVETLRTDFTSARHKWQNERADLEAKVSALSRMLETKDQMYTQNIQAILDGRGSEAMVSIINDENADPDALNKLRDSLQESNRTNTVLQTMISDMQQDLDEAYRECGLLRESMDLLSQQRALNTCKCPNGKAVRELWQKYVNDTDSSAMQDSDINVCCMESALLEALRHLKQGSHTVTVKPSVVQESQAVQVGIDVGQVDGNVVNKVDQNIETLVSGDMIVDPEVHKAMEEEINDLHQAFAHLQGELDLARGVITEKDAYADGLLKDIAKLEKVRDELIEKASEGGVWEWEQKYHRAVLEVSDVKKEYLKISKMLEEEQEGSDSLTEKHKAEIDVLQSRNEKQQAVLKAEIARLENVLVEKQSTIEREPQQLQQRESELKQMAANHIKQLEDLRSAHQQEIARLHQLQEGAIHESVAQLTNANVENSQRLHQEFQNLQADLINLFQEQIGSSEDVVLEKSCVLHHQLCHKDWAPFFAQVSKDMAERRHNQQNWAATQTIGVQQYVRGTQTDEVLLVTDRFEDKEACMTCHVLRNELSELSDQYRDSVTKLGRTNDKLRQGTAKQKRMLATMEQLQESLMDQRKAVASVRGLRGENAHQLKVLTHVRDEHSAKLMEVLRHIPTTADAFRDLQRTLQEVDSQVRQAMQQAIDERKTLQQQQQQKKPSPPDSSALTGDGVDSIARVLANKLDSHLATVTHSMQRTAAAMNVDLSALANNGLSQETIRSVENAMEQRMQAEVKLAVTAERERLLNGMQAMNRAVLEWLRNREQTRKHNHHGRSIARQYRDRGGAIAA